MNMIERVARALATAREQNGGPPFEAYDPKHARPALFDEARAAIEAMRDPTDQMIAQGDESTWEPSSERPYVGYYAIRSAWQSMIDCALSDAGAVDK